ncbi:MAG: molybdopterin-dependent oxidoreductase, partial [Planctomycetota bacterium]
MKRRAFIKGSAAAAAAATSTGITRTGWAVPNPESIELEQLEAKNDLLAACPYCGVGCGTIIKTENGRIVNVIPDKDHPTNKGLQCIKGLTSAEAIYVNRLTKPLVRKDMSDPLNGYVSKTKGSYDPSLFREASWEEAEELIAEKIVEIVKTTGGNAVGLYGSGQLSVEGQWLENQFMKGILGSNTIEANARMCMTSAVTGYFKSLGSDTPPTCYDDIELSDMITAWG